MLTHTLHTTCKMKTFKGFLGEALYRYKKHKANKSPSPYWSGVSRKRTRIGGMTYTVTYKGGKAKFTKRMRTIIGKKR